MTSNEPWDGDGCPGGHGGDQLGGIEGDGVGTGRVGAGFAKTEGLPACEEEGAHQDALQGHAPGSLAQLAVDACQKTRKKSSPLSFRCRLTHVRAKVEHPFRVIKRQFGFQKTRLRGMLKNRCKVNVLAALANLFKASHELLCRT